MQTFLEELKQIFPDVRHYFEYIPEQQVNFDVYCDELDFDKIHKVSDLFKSKSIRISADSSSGGCDTCDFGKEVWFEIYITNVNFVSN